jgi:hypothetical protein
LAIAAALLSLSLCATAGASVVRGTVVHKNRRAHSFSIADTRGRLVEIHAQRSPRIGSRVVVNVRKLHHGGYVTTHTKVGSITRHVRLKGTVTYSDRRKRMFVVSGSGVSLIVHERSSRAVRAAAAATVPAVGEQVTVDGSVNDDGSVDAADVNEDGPQQGPVDLEGVVLAIDTNARTLSLSADDDNKSGSITIALPAAFDMSAYTLGAEVKFRATLNPDGTYTAVGSADDDGVNDGEHENDDQGDIGDSAPSTTGSGTGSGGDSSGKSGD